MHKLLVWPLFATQIFAQPAAEEPPFMMTEVTTSVVPVDCTLQASPYSSCMALVCPTTVQISYTADFADAPQFPKAADFELLNSPQCLYRTDSIIYNAEGETEFYETRSLLLDRTSEYSVISKLDRTSYQVLNGDGSKVLDNISLGGQVMAYGSTQAVCTYDAGTENKCLLQGVEYNLGEMCAHQIVAVSQYIVLSCAKAFTQKALDAQGVEKNVVRKMQIYTIGDGLLIGSISQPEISGVSVSANDRIAVQIHPNGIRATMMASHLGYMSETIQYRNNIGFKQTTNAFNTCNGDGLVLSNGREFYTQVGQALYQVEQDVPIDCANIYTDSWQVLRKLAQCQQLEKLHRTNIRTFLPVSMNSTNATCGGQVNPSQYFVVDPNQPALETDIYDKTKKGPTFNDVPDQQTYWYWRDKPLRKGLKSEDQTGWIESSILDFPLSLCFERGMNCSATCCKQTYCAVSKADCINYKHRSYWELYICVIVVLSIVVGIPTCIKTMELLLMYKFCRRFDEDENAYIGGSTVCEYLTNLFTKEKKDTEIHAQEVVVEVDEVVEDEYADADPAMMPKLTATPQQKPRNKCIVCMRALFCCKSANVVPPEAEMAQIMKAQQVKDAGLQETQAHDQVQETAPLLPSETQPIETQGGGEKPQQAQADDTQKQQEALVAAAEEEQAADDEIEEDESSEFDDESEEEIEQQA